MFPDLFYNSKDGRVSQIGNWAGWFSTVGEAIGSSVEGNTRFIFGLAIPVRPFAALFLTLGIIRGRELVTDAKSSDNTKYFEYFENLPLSTNVTFLTNDKGKMRQRVGTFDGIYKSNGQKSIAIRYLDDKKNKAQGTRLFHINNCHNISILNQDSKIDISNNRKKGRSVIKSKDFISEVASNVDISVLAVTSRLDCLFVGIQKRLFFELDFDFSLINTEGKSSVQGTLKDIIRPQNNTLYSKSYRSLIYPVNLRRSPDNNGIEPWSVIFDSADGYLKWHDLFKTSHQIVLLDRTEKRFKEAAKHLDQRYYRRKDSLPDFIYNLPQTLTGIEIMCFTEN